MRNQRNRSKWLLIVGLLGSALLLTGCGELPREPALTAPEPAPDPPVAVRVVQRAAGFELQRNGKPYFIKGAGGLTHFRQIKAAGGNSVRLWTTAYAQPLLDSAHAQGLTVLLGLPLQSEREGFDYYDRPKIARQLQALREEVLRYRHHPALLAWNIGNEIDLSLTNPEVFDAVNEVARMIHALDPLHPVLTTLAVPTSLKMMGSRCPDVDLLALNQYAGLLTLPQQLREAKLDRPYIVTEFGAKGYWESPLTTWQAPVEQSSNVKADFMAERYRKAVLADRQYCLGSYIFYWGPRQEATFTWFSLFMPTGERTNLVDEMQHLWTGAYPANRAPQVGALQLDGRFDSESVRLMAGREYLARLSVIDPEQDSLQVQWEVRPEPAWQTEQATFLPAPQEVLAGCIRAQGRQHTLVRAPQQAGAYRLYTIVRDGHGGAATANLPFYVAAPAR